MRIINIISFLLVSSIGLANPVLSKVRMLYALSAEGSERCEELKSFLEKSADPTDVLLYGYKGCVRMIEANHVYNPFTKLSCFNDGKSMLEFALSRSPANLELRYLRFTIQCNIPSFLGYKKNISADKEFLLANYKQCTDTELKQNILNFLKQSDELSDTEKSRLNG